MDIGLFWNAEAQRADFKLAAPDLVPDEGLETAVLVSLFTDRRAEGDGVPPGGTDDRRGWWGDAFAAVPGDRIGSKLWLLAREKLTPETLLRTREYAEEALAWLAEDGVLERVSVRVEKAGTEMLAFEVICHRHQSAPRKYRFEKFWGRN
jgi:phage gp46-like protein